MAVESTRRKLVRVNESAQQNCNFGIHITETPGSRLFSIDAMMLCVLADIRRELRTLNRLLGCKNFTGIPKTLREIEANTKKRKYTRRSKEP